MCKYKNNSTFKSCQVVNIFEPNYVIEKNIRECLNETYFQIRFHLASCQFEPFVLLCVVVVVATACPMDPAAAAYYSEMQS